MSKIAIFLKTTFVFSSIYVLLFLFTNNHSFLVMEVKQRNKSKQLNSDKVLEYQVKTPEELNQPHAEKEMDKFDDAAKLWISPESENQFVKEAPKDSIRNEFPETLDYTYINDPRSSRQFPAKEGVDINYYKKQRLSESKNILFIVADDMRAQLNAYKEFTNLFPKDNFQMHTPNLDRLASKSLVLTQAFVQFSSCNPSRSSYMTSRRPDTTHIWDLHHYFRESGGNFTTIPQFFKDRGYRTAGMGKIYHPGKPGGFNDPLSWNEGYHIAKNGGYWAQKSTTADFALPVNETLRKEKALPDEEMVIRAVHRLREFQEDGLNGERPFFLAVGFMKPHLPIVFPEEFLKLYSIEDIVLPNNPYLPVDLNESSWYAPLEVLHCADVEQIVTNYERNSTFPDDLTRRLRRSYFAGVSYIDFLIGIILDELDVLGLTDSTIISFMGDHGWHLGENGFWGKHTNFDIGLQAPLMFHVPGLTVPGLKSNSIIEFTDIFPTLVESAGFEHLPPCPKESNNITLCTEGVSFYELFHKPEVKVRDYVYSQHRFKCNGMAYSIRTDTHRYTETIWVNNTQTGMNQYRIDLLWDSIFSAELYDYEADPEGNINLAYQKKYQSLRRELSDNLHQYIGDSIFDVPHGMCR